MGAWRLRLCIPLAIHLGVSTPIGEANPTPKRREVKKKMTRRISSVERCVVAKWRLMCLGLPSRVKTFVLCCIGVKSDGIRGERRRKKDFVSRCDEESEKKRKKSKLNHGAWVWVYWLKSRETRRGRCEGSKSTCATLYHSRLRTSDHTSKTKTKRKGKETKHQVFNSRN